MKLHSRIFTQPIRRVAFLCICTLAIYGCSGSSGSGPNEVQSSVESETDPLPGTVVTPATDAQPSTTPIVDTENPSSETLSAPSSPAEDAQLSTAAPEPPTATTTQVNFDITVPVYMSNELQVRLESGDINTTAAFVNDESWSASGVFPIDTDNPLMVTFFDRNGAITLGTVDTVFRTGTTISQSVQITADQFDTERWDSDGDGVSNIAELIAGTNPEGDILLSPVQASLEILPIKNFRISWQPSAGADFYRVLENPDGLSGFSQVSEDIVSSIRSFDHRVALYNRVNARYVVQACNASGCVDSDPLFVTGTLESAIGYFKASNAGRDDAFGGSVALSADGNTLAVGATHESSVATGINGDQTDNSASNSGAVYVFVRSNGQWQQEAYVKASNTDIRDFFGRSVSLSADGNTLAVGASGERSAATGINGDQADNSLMFNGGAVYVFSRSNGQWQQQAYVKASNTLRSSGYGSSISLSSDGDTLAVGAFEESSAATGINGDQATVARLRSAGAVYVFVRSDGQWQQQAYVKASNTDSDQSFGASVSLGADGNKLAVGAPRESSAATGINGDQTDNSADNAGAVYVFVRSDGQWQQQAYVKASNAVTDQSFGASVSLGADGNKLAVGAPRERGAATGVNGDQADIGADNSGAVFVFVRSDGQWRQQAYVKASNTDRNDNFGGNVSLSANGNMLAVGATGEDSTATGINGDQTDNSGTITGAVYVFFRSDGQWQQRAYIKASNTDREFDSSSLRQPFGGSVSMSADGNVLAIGAGRESSAATGINGDQTVNLIRDTGAVYLY